MFKKVLVATAAAVACSGALISAQATSSTPSPSQNQPSASSPPPAQAPAQASTTFTGCVYREKDVPGIHIINYDSEFDSIQIQHTAHSRRGFALGAVHAALWLKDKKGYFEMNDMLGL